MDTRLTEDALDCRAEDGYARPIMPRSAQWCPMGRTSPIPSPGFRYAILSSWVTIR